MVGDTYTISANGNLLGDEFLARLWASRFVVKLFSEPGHEQAGLEDVTGEGRVPGHSDLWIFAERQERYTKELKLRQPLLNKARRKGR
jgi:hypothetical protein